jgi:murein L,D-transpeptidase YcbB/YkuD
MFHRVTLPAALGLLISIATCGNAGAAGNEAVAATIESFITAGTAVLADETDDQRLTDVYLYYSDRDFKPIWTRDAGAKTKAKVLLKVLKAAGEHGLDPNDYSIDEIEERIDSTDPEQLAELDLLISDVFADYGRDLAKGRIDPASTSSEIHVTPKGPGPLSLIDGAEDAEDIEPYLATLAPRAWEYSALKDGLAHYRAIAAAGGWPGLPEGPTLKPAMNDPRVAVLRKRLIVTGEFKGDASDMATLYDDPLAEAVKAFQVRHGLNGDGAIGPGTLAALNVPVEERVAQLVINLERRRWIEDDLGQFYIFVNLADALLRVMRENGSEDETVHEARLVVGEPTKRTPVFTENMSFIVFNPYWEVPPSIANNEYLPKLRHDAGYLARQNIRIMSASGEVDPWSVDWSSMSRMPYRLRQDSGEGNALGRIKFMFPNPYNIYIHDTPSKRLFEKEKRFFSHGCMRVQHPATLAEVLLKGQGWSLARIESQMASGEQRIVNLATKIPVHVNYLTAWVDKAGAVQFRPDVYGRDKPLIEALVEN